MSHRTQITLSDEEYARLKRESERTGLALAELVRQALHQTYGAVDADVRERAIQESFGAWARPGETGEGYVEALRRGLARRLPSS